MTSEDWKLEAKYWSDTIHKWDKTDTRFNLLCLSVSLIESALAAVGFYQGKIVYPAILSLCSGLMIWMTIDYLKKSKRHTQRWLTFRDEALRNADAQR